MKRTGILVVFMVAALLSVNALGNTKNTVANKSGGDQKYYVSTSDENSKNVCVLWENISAADSELIVESISGKKAMHSLGYYSEEEAQQIKAAVKPNTVTEPQVISAKGITKVSFQTNLCGIAAEPSPDENFHLSYVGLEDKALYDISIESKDGTLSIAMNGKENHPFYINVSPESRTNTLLLQIPQKTVKEIVFTDTASAYYFKDLSIPITGDTVSGLLKADKAVIDADYNLSCINGNVYLLGETLAANATQTLSAINGTVVFQVKEMLGSADLSCINGDVNATVKTLSGQLKGSCINGSVFVTLEQEPKNLTFRPSVGHNGDSQLPAGWENGHTVGNGSGRLTLSAKNGEIALEIKK